MKILKLTGMFATLLLLAACVTINVYFPAAQAEAAAERIVDDILGKQKQEGMDKGAGDKGASLESPDYRQIAGHLLDFLIAPAQAAQPDYNVDTPAIRKIQAAMKQRHRSLEPFYSSGAIGFTNDAMVDVRDASVVSLKERNRLKSLVSSENGDRNALYRAIADANGHPEWEADIRRTFASKWIERASSGWWYQDSSGKWKNK
jgi:uncharacterized protein YdbL (DUF1318 family)